MTTNFMENEVNAPNQTAAMRLEKFLQENKVGVFTAKDFQPATNQAESQAEVAEFLQLREEWRRNDMFNEREPTHASI